MIFESLGGSGLFLSRVALIAVGIATAVAGIGPALAGDLASPQSVAANGNLYFGVRAVGAVTRNDASPISLPAGAQGFQTTSDRLQLNIGGSAFLGYAFGSLPLRTEFELGYKVRHDIDVRTTRPGIGLAAYKNNLGVYDARINLLVDVMRRPWGYAYVGGGAGVAILDAELTREGAGGFQAADETESEFTASLQAGVVVKVTEQVGVELGYRYVYYGDIKSNRFDDGAQIFYRDLNSHDVLLGLIYDFGR